MQRRHRRTALGRGGPALLEIEVPAGTAGVWVPLLGEPALAYGRTEALVLTADLLDELGVAGCGPDDQERAVKEWLATTTAR